MLQFWRDLRYSLRALTRTPRFTIIAAFTLALGIGSTTAIFSAVNGVLLKPLPYPESDRVVGVWHSAPDLGYDQFGISPGIFYVYRSENEVYEEMGLYQGFTATLTGDGDPARLEGTRVNFSLFDVLQVSPLFGRTYTQEEDMPGAPNVIVISYGLWQSRYGGERSVLGRTIQLNSQPYEVIGVMPAGFNFADGQVQSQFWLPVGIDPESANRVLSPLTQ